VSDDKKQPLTDKVTDWVAAHYTTPDWDYILPDGSLIPAIRGSVVSVEIERYAKEFFSVSALPIPRDEGGAQ